MDANVKIEPFWRVVRFKQQYWIQLFAENGAYRTLTKTTRKPVRIGDYLLVQASAGKCMTVVYLDEKQDEAVPLFIAEQVDVWRRFYPYCLQRQGVFLGTLHARLEPPDAGTLYA